MRAISSVRPKCSHRCVSLKETPLKTCAIPQAHNQKLSRANRHENEMVQIYGDLNLFSSFSYKGEGETNLLFCNRILQSRGAECRQAPDAPSKRITAKCTIKTYFFDLLSWGGPAVDLFNEVKRVRFDGAFRSDTF